MRLAYLLSILFVISTVNAKRRLLTSTTDPYGIVAAAQAGNETAAVSGFTQAGNVADVTSAAAALAQIFNTVTGTHTDLSFVALQVMLRIDNAQYLSLQPTNQCPHMSL